MMELGEQTSGPPSDVVVAPKRYQYEMPSLMRVIWRPLHLVFNLIPDFFGAK